MLKPSHTKLCKCIFVSLLHCTCVFKWSQACMLQCLSSWHRDTEGAGHCRNTASDDQTYPCSKSHSSRCFSNLRHSLHANLCVGGEYNYIRLVLHKDLQAAVCSSIPPERERGNSSNKDGWIYHAKFMRRKLFCRFRVSLLACSCD